MPAGKKCYTVVIPDEVLAAETRIVNACVRGIFDTDGCVAFDRRKAYRNPYVRIILHMQSPVLLQQIHAFLHTQRIHAKLTGDRLQINGAQNCASFIEKIGFSNERHRAKLRAMGICGFSSAQSAKI